MKRRKFLFWSLFGGIFSSVISSCSNSFAKPDDIDNTNNSSQLKNNKETFVKIGTITELKDKGNILNEDFALGSVLVMYNQKNSIIAIDPTCTHEGCIVAWKKEEKAFVCPCHQSTFTEEGKVIEGRAQFPLNSYEVKIEGENILIQKQAA